MILNVWRNEDSSFLHTFNIIIIIIIVIIIMCMK